ncbi:MAG TPA: cellulase family glycosylhydrolase [Bacteroidales bacterium]|nr:cellulase family glycosylhydrolase [Bacteroidales bacterium]
MKFLSPLILFLSLAVFSCTREKPHFVSTNGREIVKADGEKLILRGVNLGFWLLPEGYPFSISNIYAAREYYDLVADLAGPDYSKAFWKTYQDSFITEKDIMYIKSLGLNSVRIPFDYRLFADEFYLGSYTPRGFELLDRVVGWCRKAGLWVILDMHAAPGSQAGWNTDDGYTYPWLFEDGGEDSRQQAIDIWTGIAQHYAADTTILGYDLLGEPIHQYSDTAKLYKRLEPFYKDLVGSVRKVDKNHICFLAGAFWNRNFDVFTGPFDSKLVYTTHLYSSTDAYTSVDYYINFSKKYNVPIWLGEFGERDSSFVDSLRTVFEENNMGWCLWPYKKMNNNHCLMQIPEPANFDLVTTYANGCYCTMEQKVTARPDIHKTRKVLDQLLENIKFENCNPSDYYFKALGIETR